jgi:hypothetical protein
MSGFVPYAFTDAQLVDIRRFCGYPPQSNGQVLFPAPWINVQYLALDYRLQTLSADEAGVVINTYLANLYTLESAIPGFAAQVYIGVAAVFTRNKDTMREARLALDDWRMRLCGFLGIEPGPDLQGRGGGQIRLIA